MLIGIIVGIGCTILFGIITFFSTSNAYIPFLILAFAVPMLLTRHLLFLKWKKTTARKEGCSEALISELAVKYKVKEINYRKINIWIFLLLLSAGLTFMSHKIKDRETQLAFLAVSTTGTVSGLSSHKGEYFAVISFPAKNKTYKAKLKLNYEFGRSFYILPDTMIFPKAGDIFTVRYSVKDPEINEVIPTSLVRKMP